MLSEELLQQRQGNFTASGNHALMAGWRDSRPDSSFPEFLEISNFIRIFGGKPSVGDAKLGVSCKVTGDLINQTWRAMQFDKPSAGLVTYAESKALEEFFYIDPSLNFSTASTRNGEEREVECMERLIEATGLNFTNIGEDQIHIHADSVGVTPDGVVINEFDIIETGAEVKCKSPLVHLKNMMIKNNDDLINNEFAHFVQIQTAMLVTGADHWYFANYNPFAKHENLKFSYIIIDRDDAFISIMKKRLVIAKKIKQDFYNSINII